MISISRIVSCLNRRLVGVIAGLAIVLAGLSAIGTTTASADTVPTTSLNCAPGSGTWVGLHDVQGNVLCIIGTGTLVPQDFIPAPYTSMVIHVKNRVWLHQFANSTGWADCFETQNPPHAYTLTGRDQNPGNLQISANTAPCP